MHPRHDPHRVHIVVGAKDAAHPTTKRRRTRVFPSHVVTLAAEWISESGNSLKSRQSMSNEAASSNAASGATLPMVSCIRVPSTRR